MTTHCQKNEINSYFRRFSFQNSQDQQDFEVSYNLDKSQISPNHELPPNIVAKISQYYYLIQ